MHAVLLAGGTPGSRDPLYQCTLGSPKCALSLAGRPMVQWVVNALAGASSIERIWVAGPAELGPLECSKPVTRLRDEGSLLANLLSGMRSIRAGSPNEQRVLGICADIPAITPKIVDWVVRTSDETDHDAHCTVVERDTMEARFPGARRTWVRVGAHSLCMGDLAVLRLMDYGRGEALYARLEASRKRPVRQALLLGLEVALPLILRRGTLDSLAEKVGRRLGFRCRVVICPHAEVGMDVDRPEHATLMSQYLVGRADEDGAVG